MLIKQNTAPWDLRCLDFSVSDVSCPSGSGHTQNIAGHPVSTQGQMCSATATAAGFAVSAGLALVSLISSSESSKAFSSFKVL